MLEAPYTGEIRMWPINFAPVGWHFCDGSSVSISNYNALFSLIGTIYGGNGVSTFNLPDLRGRVPVHVGQGTEGIPPIKLAQMSGSNTIALTPAQMPPHTHTLSAQTNVGNTSSPENNIFADTGVNDKEYALGTVTPNVVMGDETISTAGGSLPIGITQPSIGLNFIICLNGIYPQPTY